MGETPRAVVLVRNAVTHDARVLREVDTLRREGFAVLVVGVVSTVEPARRARIGGIEVVRVDPRPWRRLPWRRAPRRAAESVPPAAAPPVSSAAAPPDAAWRRVISGRHARRARRLLLTAGYYARGAALVRRTRPQLVHANDYNTMWIALCAKALCGSRIVYDAHELWADRNGRPEWRPWLVACEALFLRAADATMTASPGYGRELARRYRVPPPTVVRNIPDAAPPPDAGDPAGAPGPPLAIYVGGLMPGRGLEPAIRALAGVPELRMRLVGPGGAAYRASLLALAADCDVADRLELAAPVAPDQVVAAAAPADFGLMLMEPICRSYELTLPNKLFEYALAGVPMVASDLPVIGSLVADHGLGEVVSPSDVPAVSAAMRRLLDPRGRAERRRRVRTFAAANRWTDERRRLAAVYATALGTGTTTRSRADETPAM